MITPRTENKTLNGDHVSEVTDFGFWTCEPSSSGTDENVEKVRHVIRENRRLTINDVWNIIGPSRRSI